MENGNFFLLSEETTFRFTNAFAEAIFELFKETNFVDYKKIPNVLYLRDNIRFTFESPNNKYSFKNVLETVDYIRKFQILVNKKRTSSKEVVRASSATKISDITREFKNIKL